MKKIIFGITSLTVGGAERVLVDLVNRLQDDYEITVFTLYDKGLLQKDLGKKVRKLSLYRKEYSEMNFTDKLKASLKLIFYKKKIHDAILKREYDYEVAFLEGPITRLFSAKSSTKKIAWVHNDISKVYGNGIKAKIKKMVDGKAYQKYDKIVFVSDENKQDFNLEYEWAEEEKEEIIRNYIDSSKVLKKAEEKVNLPYVENDINFLIVCRLVEQKALDRFIKVQKELENRGIHIKVYIIGEGNLRLNLQKEIDSLGLTEDTVLLGGKENPYPYIKNCDYFCLPSYYEGYGMVLEEAKILNKPIILTDTAARECAKGYNKAIVVENTFEGLVNGIEKELKNNNMKLLGTTEENLDYEEIELNIVRKVKKLFEYND